MIDFLYQVIHCELLSENISRIILKPLNKLHLSYQAGQYIKVLHADGQLSPMSIANSVNDASLIELHLYHPLQNSLAQDLLQIIKDKKQLILRGPYGKCTVSIFDPQLPIILIADSTGFAPVKALIEELALSTTYRSLHLYWHGLNKEDLYLFPLVKQWCENLNNFKFTPVIAKPIELVVLQDYPSLFNYQIFAVDTSRNIHNLLAAFVNQGLLRHLFYSDVFDYVHEHVLPA